jgi:flagellar biosynthesis regulator FlaF
MSYLTTAWEWISRHVVQPYDDHDRQQSREAIERANQAADTWDARAKMSAALQWERRFWARVHDDGHTSDG